MISCLNNVEKPHKYMPLGWRFREIKSLLIFFRRDCTRMLMTDEKFPDSLPK